MIGSASNFLSLATESLAHPWSLMADQRTDLLAAVLIIGDTNPSRGRA